MPVNRGKDFEKIIGEAFREVPNTSVYRLYDTMGGYSGIANVSDFIIYKKPYQYFIECKSVKGNTLSISGNDPKRKYGMISNTQWDGMLEMSKVDGVYAGVICWWTERDVTAFLPIQLLNELYNTWHKSIRYDFDIDEMTKDFVLDAPVFRLNAQKKRVFFDYDMRDFFARF